MYKNYILTAVRNLLRYKQYTLINIVGLAVGLAASILIAIYVNFELSYDQWIPENDRVMRIEAREYDKAGALKSHEEGVQGIASTIFGEQIPDIELRARFYNSTVAAAWGNKAVEQDVTVSDPDVFELMGIDLLEGDASTALDNPDSIILSKSDAERIFGSEIALGQTLKVEGQYLLKVTGVMPDWPVTSDLEVSALVPLETPFISHMPWALKSWGSFWGPTYVRLRKGATVTSVEKQMNDLAARVGPSHLFQERIEEGIKPVLEYYLTQAVEAHLSNSDRGAGGHSDYATLWTAALIAFLILAIAVINVTNLGTMLAMKRVKEVAIRKALGAEGRHLMVQIQLEAVALAFLAMLIGLALAEVLLPVFGNLMNRDLTDTFLYNPLTIIGLLAGTMLVGMVSGLYPALVAIRFRPVDHLSGIKPHLGVRFRNALVVVQFAATIALLITCIVVFRQAEYARIQNKGFDTAQLIAISGVDKPIVRKREAALRKAFEQIPGIEAVAASHGMAGYDYNNKNDMRVDTGVQAEMRRFSVSVELLDLMNVRPIAGRLFSNDHPMDAETTADHGASKSVILNDLAVKELGFETAEAAIGHEVYTWDNFKSKIVGVIENLRWRSARQAPSATYYWVGPHEFRHIILRVKVGHMAEAMAAIDKTWMEFFPDIPVRRQFVDQAFAEYYDNDRRRGWLLLFSVCVMTVIAVMGLYGLAALATERRAKEIGIRKVLGAQSHNIVRLLVWQFSIPILIANLIAWPFAWWGLSVWLQTFVDRIDMSIIPFFLSGGAVLAVAWATIIVLAMKVVNSNPIKALRYE